MWNGNPNSKKLACIVILVLIIVGAVCYRPQTSFCYAEQSDAQQGNEEKFEEELKDNIDDILDDIDSGELDDFIQNDFNFDFFSGSSFMDLVKKLLSGNYFEEYDSVTQAIIGFVKSNFKKFFTFIFTIFSLVIIFEVFNKFCEDKYTDLKKVINVIFSILISLSLLVYSKNIFSNITDTINKIFSFSRILFPILLGLVFISGANGTYSVYNSLSVFLINTGSYIFIYILLPIVSCIVILTVLSAIFSKNKFNKLISVLKSAFKYIIIAFFSIFGIFSSINMFSSGFSDGVNYRLTKFAIKSYVPFLGGYLSDGFDFIHTCSVLIKNSFGICGILVLLFFVIQPILVCLLYSFSLKCLSVFVSFIGNGDYADYFEKVSVSISFLVTIVVGVFLCLFIFIYLLILSVSVI